MNKLKLLFVMGSFLFGVSISFFVFGTASKASAAPQAGLSMLQDASRMVCPVSDEKLQRAMAAFEKMMPTFQHPRCANCHGGIRPFEANTDHGGGKFAIELSPEGDVMYDQTFAPCQTCHGGLKNWEVPDAEQNFVGKDAVELCKQMKVLGQAEDFIDHITRDRGKTPFIETAFEGMRGFNAEGIEFYEALYDKKPVPEPPAISHAGLIDQAKAWVDALGGEFQGDLGCGCEPQQYAIQIDESYTAEFNPPKARFTWDGSSQALIPIRFNDDGTFTGELTSKRTMKATLTSAISCSPTVITDVKWQVTGKLDSNTNTMTFSIRFTPSPGFAECGMVPLPLPIDDSENPNNPLKQVEMRALISETKTVELNTSATVSTSKDIFKITIIKLD